MTNLPNQQATSPAMMLFATWSIGVAKPDFKMWINVLVIVIGIVISSFGELHFVLFGVVVQILAVVCEAYRLALIQRILSSPEFRMDPMVSLYFYAPVCAVLNLLVAFMFDIPTFSMEDLWQVGLGQMLMNASIAFMLNISSLMLVSRYDVARSCLGTRLTVTSTDRHNLSSRSRPFRHSQEYSHCLCLDGHLGHSRHAPRILRLRHFHAWPPLLQPRRRDGQEILDSAGAVLGDIWCARVPPSQICGLFGLSNLVLCFRGQFCAASVHVRLLAVSDRRADRMR